MLRRNSQVRGLGDNHLRRPGNVAPPQGAASSELGAEFCETAGRAASQQKMAIAGLEVGASVLVRNQPATVRFVGETDFAEGVWVGLSLQRAVGRNDGSVQGVRYFSCQPEHGLFVPPSHVTTAPATTAADQPKAEIASAWADIESLQEAEALKVRAPRYLLFSAQPMPTPHFYHGAIMYAPHRQGKRANA